MYSKKRNYTNYSLNERATQTAHILDIDIYMLAFCLRFTTDMHFVSVFWGLAFNTSWRNDVIVCRRTETYHFILASNNPTRNHLYPNMDTLAGLEYASDRDRQQNVIFINLTWVDAIHKEYFAQTMGSSSTVGGKPIINSFPMLQTSGFQLRYNVSQFISLLGHRHFVNWL